MAQKFQKWNQMTLSSRKFDGVLQRWLDYRFYISRVHAHTNKNWLLFIFSIQIRRRKFIDIGHVHCSRKSYYSLTSWKGKHYLSCQSTIWIYSFSMYCPQLQLAARSYYYYYYYSFSHMLCACARFQNSNRMVAVKFVKSFSTDKVKFDFVFFFFKYIPNASEVEVNHSACIHLHRHRHTYM